MSDDAVRFDRVRDVLVASVSGEVDISNAPALERAVLAAAPPEEVTGLVVDLSDVGFLDSAGVRLLFTLHGELTEQGRPMALVLPEGSPVERVLAIVDIDRVVWVGRTLDEALGHLEDPEDPLPRPA
jgi:anti-anti-sigma factor